MLTGSRQLHKHWPRPALIIYNTCIFPTESSGRLPPTEAFLFKFTTTFQGKRRNSSQLLSVHMPAERLFILLADEALQLICSPPARLLRPVSQSCEKAKIMVENVSFFKRSQVTPAKTRKSCCSEPTTRAEPGPSTLHRDLRSRTEDAGRRNRYVDGHTCVFITFTAFYTVDAL